MALAQEQKNAECVRQVLSAPRLIPLNVLPVSLQHSAMLGLLVA